MFAGLLPAGAIAGSAPAASTLLRPFRSTAAGDLYHISDSADIARVRLVGYRSRWLSARALRRSIDHGVLAVSLRGRAVRLRLVASARRRRLRRRHGLILTVVARSHAGVATSASISSPTSASAYAGVVESTPGLVSYWRLDDTSGTRATDAFGTNPGSYVGAPGSGYVLRAGGLIRGDGDAAVAFTNGGVTVPSSATLQPGSRFTVETWIKPAGTDAGQLIAAKGSSWRMRFDSFGHLTFGIYVAGAEYQANSGRGLAPGTTHHVVGTYDGATARLYLDGVQVASVSHGGSVGAGSRPFVVGYNGGVSATYRFNGTLDEVAYYNTALSAAQVQSHYGAGTGTLASTPSAPSAPTVSITSGPAAGSTQTSASASFAFTSNRSGSTFQCSLDGAPYASCSSPASYSSLVTGSHTFSVEASDSGLTSSPASVTWTVSVPPPSPPSSSCPVPYSPTSPWNMPIPANPTVDPNNSAYIASLTTNTPYPKLGSDPTQYTMPVYTVDSSTPTLAVYVSGVYSNVTGETAMSKAGGTVVSIPIPANAQPAAGGDSQVIVWDPSTGDEWGFWGFSNGPSGMTATNGYHYNTLWSGAPPSGFGSRGAGVPYLAGLIRPCEIAQGHIDHALAFSYQNTTPQFVHPATKSDGHAGSGMPEGAHLQLDPSISDGAIRGWGCTDACFIAAKAMQKYGMYLIDTAGHPKVYFEYSGTAGWGATVTASTTNPIPLSALRVVDG